MRRWIASGLNLAGDVAYETALLLDWVALIVTGGDL